MQLFQQLGAKIEQTWRDKNYDDEIFHEIAVEALQEADLPQKVSVWEIAEWALRENYLPKQMDLDGKFGDPPITLYNSPRFYIDVYFWLEGTTAIHQHSFCGAFQVLQGSSIHSQYDFLTDLEVNNHFKLGKLTLREVKLLETGNIHSIAAGENYIHALFHLDYPSATIVVRNLESIKHLPQYSYQKPSIAINPFFDEPTLRKKQQIISLLMRAKPENADSLIKEMLAQSDLHSSFLILTTLRNFLEGNQMEKVFALSASKNRFQDFLNVVLQKHGELAESFAEVFAEQERINEIVRRRHLVSDAELRFFLALLLNVSGRERILSLIKTRFPDDEPTEKILDWTETLGRTRTMDVKTSNLLGIEDFSDDYIFVIEQLLQGKDLSEISKYLHENYPPHYVTQIKAKLPEICEKLLHSPLFKPLLAD